MFLPCVVVGFSVSVIDRASLYLDHSASVLTDAKRRGSSKRVNLGLSLPFPARPSCLRSTTNKI